MFIQKTLVELKSKSFHVDRNNGALAPRKIQSIHWINGTICDVGLDCYCSKTNRKNWTKKFKKIQTFKLWKSNTVFVSKANGESIFLGNMQLG